VLVGTATPFLDRVAAHDNFPGHNHIISFIAMPTLENLLATTGLLVTWPLGHLAT
jgi:hypothetical protein